MGFACRNRRLHSVVGTALKPPARFLETSTAQAGRPTITEKDVDEFHERYVAALIALYDRHKGCYGKASADASLEIW